jgi:transposase
VFLAYCQSIGILSKNIQNFIMGNKKITMQKLRQVLRFYSQGKGTKTISSIVGISRNTVKKYLQIFHTLHMDFEDVVGLEDSRLGELFSLTPKPVVHDPRYTVLESLLPSYCKRLRHKGMSRRKLYKEYITEHPDGYSLASFDRFIQRHIGMSNPVMHLEHKAGDKLFIDFAGDKLSIIDLDTGEIIPVEFFVAILPCSQLTYVEAVMSQKKEDLIRASENALLYYQGVPSAIIPDNLKSAVTKSSKYEAILNEDFAAFAEHYGCTVIPARAYKPRDKALVEGAVKLIYRSIYPKIQEREFYDLDSLNAAIRVALELHNNTPLTGRKYSRREQFEEIERDSLRKLNPIRFELRHRYRATVMKNGHVRLGEDAHYYSVPCRYIGKKVILSYTSRQVCIYYGYELIATHTRNRARCRYTTLEEHLASHHRYITEWNPDKFIHEAAAIHPDVEAYIRRVMEEKKHPEQAYKSCQGILSFARRVGNTRLTNACRWATSYGLYNYPIIERILNNRQDEFPLEDSAGQETEMPSHENIRGKEYYQ